MEAGWRAGKFKPRMEALLQDFSLSLQRYRYLLKAKKQIENVLKIGCRLVRLFHVKKLGCPYSLQV